jgi:pimeloyl-ACP methyl ester carboxylesterase
VLDGAVDPLTSGTRRYAIQLQGFENAFDQFAVYCRRHSPCAGIGSPRSTVSAIEPGAQRAPLATGTSRPLTAALASTGVLEALYSKGLWDDLGSALVEGKQGDGAGLLKLADKYNQRDAHGHYTNVNDANSTIGCNDSEHGPTDAAIHRIATDWARRFPLFGTWSLPSLFTCQSWQPDRVVPPRPSAVTSARVLVVGNLHDPATPYSGAVHLAETMGNAELLSWDGEGHTSYLQGSTCIDDYVNGYLLARKLPPEDSTCQR